MWSGTIYEIVAEVLFLVVALTFFAFVGFGGEPTVDASAYDKVQLGMSLNRVIDILGVPSDNNTPKGGDDPEQPVDMVWRNGSKEIRVIFVNDRVYNKSRKGF